MNITELEHFTANNKQSSISNTRYITGIALTAISRGIQTVYFYNGVRVPQNKYDALAELHDSIELNNTVTTIIEYKLIDCTVTMHYYKGTLEKITKEYCNDHGVNVTDVTTNFEIGE